MVEIKERYLWAVFLILVIAGSVYLRYYYQPQIMLSINFVNASLGNYYPYQRVVDPISVQNAGSGSISNLSFGLYINNNLSRTYRMSIPPGKEATVNFNFTPSQPGIYKVTLAADPNKLYNIGNRGGAQANLSVTVVNAERPEPYVTFSNNGLIGEDSYLMTAPGYDLSIFLLNNTGAKQFLLTGSQQLNSLIYPALDVYYNYLKNISVAHAYYKNYTLVGLWVQGYLTPDAIAEAAIGKGFNVTHSANVTIINFGSNTTMCSWYSNGWVKTLSSTNGVNCLYYINPKSYKKINASYENRFIWRSTKMYNYSGFYKNYNYSGQWSVMNNKSLLYQSIQRGGNFTNVCYGSIQSFNNISYCSTYYLEASNTVLVKTTSLIKDYNLSAWSLTGQKQLVNASTSNINVIKAFNITGPSAQFVTGFANSCTINAQMYCFASLWNYSAITIGVQNKYNYTAFLKRVACYTTGVPKFTALNTSLPSQNYTYITIPCYQNSTAIQGVPLGLAVHIELIYNVSNALYDAKGNAQLVG